MECVSRHLSSPIQHLTRAGTPSSLSERDLAARAPHSWDVVGTIGSLRVTLHYDRCGSLPRLVQ